MIFAADTSVKDISTFGLLAMLDDIHAELKRRKIEKANSDMTLLWKAVENFQKEGHKDAVFVDVNGDEMKIADIGEIYDYENNCGFTFGPWFPDEETETLEEN